MQYSICFKGDYIGYINYNFKDKLSNVEYN